MNLVVEIGNTNTKFALFTGRELNQLWSGKEDDILWEKLREFQIQNAILSGSGHTHVAWWHDIQAEKKLIFMNIALRIL